MKINEETSKEELEELIEASETSHYGLPVVKDGEGNSWAIAVDDKVRQEAVTESIKETLWACYPSVLAKATGLPERVFGALASEELGEEVNETLLILVDGTCGIDAVVEEVLERSDYGNFLSREDGEELEFDCGFYGYLVERA